MLENPEPIWSSLWRKSWSDCCCNKTRPGNWRSYICVKKRRERVGANQAHWFSVTTLNLHAQPPSPWNTVPTCTAPQSLEHCTYMYSPPVLGTLHLYAQPPSPWNTVPICTAPQSLEHCTYMHSPTVLRTLHLHTQPPSPWNTVPTCTAPQSLEHCTYMHSPPVLGTLYLHAQPPSP